MCRARNLYLIGMMGAGKTTVGRLLARRLKRPFYDSDQVVEERCGVAITVIFDVEGEAGFRLRESQAIAELTALKGIVLATGGGVVLDPENRRRLSGSGTVVYLHARADELFARVRHGRGRPLLAGPDPLRRLEQIYAQRDPLYRETADWVVETGRQSATAMARDLLARLGDEWKRSA